MTDGTMPYIASTWIADISNAGNRPALLSTPPEEEAKCVLHKVFV